MPMHRRIGRLPRWDPISVTASNTNINGALNCCEAWAGKASMAAATEAVNSQLPFLGWWNRKIIIIKRATHGPPFPSLRERSTRGILPQPYQAWHFADFDVESFCYVWTSNPVPGHDGFLQLAGSSTPRCRRSRRCSRPPNARPLASMASSRNWWIRALYQPGCSRCRPVGLDEEAPVLNAPIFLH